MSTTATPVRSPGVTVRSEPRPPSILGSLTLTRASRWSAYSELAKPRIGLMVLVSVAVGYTLAGQGTWPLGPFVHASFGILLAVVASSSLNQYLERHTDRLMARTKNRPLPSGRLSAEEVLVFGLVCSVSSFGYLFVLVNPLTAWLTLATIVMYAGLYTPLKRSTAFCTVLGAIPGAMPPVLGWVAAGGTLDVVAFSLFAILFLWQFPHFLAIAWIYLDQYRAAGLKMVPGAGREKVTGVIALGYALVLIPISLLPMQFGAAGTLYGALALLLGLAYAGSAGLFLRHECRRTARRLLFVSLFYLPGVLFVLMIDHLRLLS